MKKTSFIILTFLASLSLDVCQAQEINPAVKSITPDTVIVDESDTVRYYSQSKRIIIITEADYGITSSALSFREDITQPSTGLDTCHAI